MGRNLCCKARAPYTVEQARRLDSNNKNKCFLFYYNNYYHTHWTIKRVLLQ